MAVKVGKHGKKSRFVRQSKPPLKSSESRNRNRKSRPWWEITVTNAAGRRVAVKVSIFKKSKTYPTNHAPDGY